MLPVELWESSFKSSSLPVERKYQKGNQGIIEGNIFSRYTRIIIGNHNGRWLELI
jgi:hypothetical protein